MAPIAVRKRAELAAADEARHAAASRRPSVSRNCRSSWGGSRRWRRARRGRVEL